MEAEKPAGKRPGTKYKAAFKTEAVRPVNQDGQMVARRAHASGRSEVVLGEWERGSRGGFCTKLHAVVAAEGNCLHLALTPGHWADCAQLPTLLAALPHPPGAVVADKAYDTNAVLQALAYHHAEPVIPPKTSRNQPRTYDQNLYADRNKAERFFGRLKEARGFATRYEKTAVSFLATAHLLATLDWMR